MGQLILNGMHHFLFSLVITLFLIQEDGSVCTVMASSTHFIKSEIFLRWQWMFTADSL